MIILTVPMLPILTALKRFLRPLRSVCRRPTLRFITFTLWVIRVWIRLSREEAGILIISVMRHHACFTSGSLTILIMARPPAFSREALPLCLPVSLPRLPRMLPRILSRALAMTLQGISRTFLHPCCSPVRGMILCLGMPVFSSRRSVIRFRTKKKNFKNYFSSSALEELKSVCSTVTSRLEPFTHGSSGLPLYAVCHQNGTLYSQLWNPEAIPLYVKWLKDNLDSIIESLNLMSSEASSKWDSGNLQTADTAGPFRFGFVFKDSSWTSSSTFKSHLPPKITSLTASLQNLLADLLFVCPWDNALLGHAICFLYTFCSKVSAEEGLKEKLKKYSGDLKTVCHDLQNHLQPFIFGSSYLFAVCQKNTKLFDGIWDDNKFDKYCEWLRKHLKNIIEALKAISWDCKQWTKGKLKEASSAGPSRFGFVFKDDFWDASTSKSQLPSKISPLTASAENSGSLKKLKECLEPSSSAGAAGGLFGAGAAYATNAFGFQNLITSFISSFLK
ncbi:hypothetical protein X943_003841 [Babesia divergens]|uniref:Uncharacterized protein n=1 Tax=Babesia divergens TaxID=32595 RepID=A0AAD9GBG2_BABDI|nr:hypothetical protein X943_003841 [Babesia divergens]